MPTQNPAWKISAMAEQLLRETVSRMNNTGKNERCTMLFDLTYSYRGCAKFFPTMGIVLLRRSMTVTENRQAISEWHDRISVNGMKE